MRTIALLTLWCATSAPATAGEPPPCATPPADAVTLTVATFNAWGLPWPIARRRRARMAATADWLATERYDIVGLQEIWRGARRHLELGGLHPPSLEGGDSGLALFTPHPLTPPSIRPFEDSVGIDGLKRKGVLTTTVEVTNVGPIGVAVTHLQSRGTRRAARVRQAQTEAVKRAALAMNGPSVLIGDFNFHDDVPLDDDAAAGLIRAGWQDAAAVVGVLDPTYHGDSDRFDRVWVRSFGKRCLAPIVATVEAQPAGAPSDHLAVITTLAAWNIE